MKAELAPLEGKYYGTEVRILPTDEKEFSEGHLLIWVAGNHKPSERELEGYELKDGKWQLYDKELDEWFEYEICDSHYETETSLALAMALIEAVNK